MELPILNPLINPFFNLEEKIMVKVLGIAIEKARKVFIDEIKECVKENSNKIEINDNAELYKCIKNPEGEDITIMFPCFIGCIRVDEDGEVVVDYKDDEDAYTDMLESLSFDELVNICEKIKEN